MTLQEKTDREIMTMVVQLENTKAQLEKQLEMVRAEWLRRVQEGQQEEKLKLTAT
jgi:hypothetical protein